MHVPLHCSGPGDRGGGFTQHISAPVEGWGVRLGVELDELVELVSHRLVASLVVLFASLVT